jgi:CubicO group peptidase (beta-lactamase class C family)
MNTRVILCLALLGASAASAKDLGGLWKSKKRFGPDARGTVVVQRHGSTWTAEFAGRVLPARVDGGVITFATPDDEGRFRGKFDGDAIEGHWLRAGTSIYRAPNNAPVSASAVQLRPDGTNRWRGTIDPGQETFTLFLLLQPKADGSFRAVLQNAERDMGSQLGVERLTRDGDRLTLIGKRGGKEQEASRGTYDEENDVITLAFPSRGGTYNFERDNDQSHFYPRGKNPGRYSYRAPLAFDDGWTAGTLDAAAIDRATIEKFVQGILDEPMDNPDARQVHALLIARHGKLVLEEYFHGQDRDKLHNLRSASKSVTSVAIGAAMFAGVPLKLSSPVYQVMNGGTFPADVDPQKRTMTLEHLLTMSSGYFCDDTNDSAPGNEETMWEQAEEPDFYRYTMKVPLATPPGENSVYCSASPNLALGMAGAAAHEDPMALFARLVARPMKIRRYEWGLDRVGHPYGGGGMNLLARDFIKFGQLLLNGGTWNGRRIISEQFAANSGAPLYHLRNIYYGYLWWMEEYPYRNRTVHAISARGAGGQTVTVVPELDLIVGTLAGSFANRKAMFASSTDPIARLILPAVREPGDDPNAPVVEREFQSPYGPSKDGSRVRKK